jgi:hypothetical protein
MKTLLLLAALTAEPAAKQPTDAPFSIEIPVGEERPSPVPVAAEGICDDRSVVEVVVKEDHLVLKGLKVGHTPCGFRSNARLPPKVVDVNVIEKEKK